MPKREKSASRSKPQLVAGREHVASAEHLPVTPPKSSPATSVDPMNAATSGTAPSLLMPTPPILSDSGLSDASECFLPIIDESIANQSFEAHNEVECSGSPSKSSSSSSSTEKASYVRAFAAGIDILLEAADALRKNTEYAVQSESETPKRGKKTKAPSTGFDDSDFDIWRGQGLDRSAAVDPRLKAVLGSIPKFSMEETRNTSRGHKSSKRKRSKLARRNDGKGASCHLCKNKKAWEHMLSCTHYKGNGDKTTLKSMKKSDCCRYHWCKTCLAKYEYSEEDLEQLWEGQSEMRSAESEGKSREAENMKLWSDKQATGDWTCPSCTRMCTCSSCKKKKK